MRDQDNQQAAFLASLAAQQSPATSSPLVFAGIWDWATWNAQNVAAEAVCDAGEWAMKRRGRRTKSRQRGTSGAPVAGEAGA